MLLIDEFEQAIIKFGVKAALEYFATPETEHHLWDDKWIREVLSKPLQNTVHNSDYAKLPRFNEVYKKAYALDGDKMTVATFYECLKELSNFA